MDFRTLNIFTNTDPGLLKPNWVVSGPIDEVNVVLADGESVAIGDLLFFNAVTGGWNVADGAAPLAGAAAPALAVALEVVADPGEDGCSVFIKAALPGSKVAGYSGLTPGAVLYLSNAAPGGMVELAPDTADETIQKVGIALSATTVLFFPSIDFSVAAGS